ncbi:MAG: hypothetical protein PHV20_12485 [Bacteroidales bacterium]|nr:hypothetical protein [Bacteroidales bacterium]
MNNEVKVTIMVFSDYYDGHSDEQKKIILDLVMKEIGCSISNFYYRKRTNGWSISDMKVLNTAFSENKINFQFNV